MSQSRHQHLISVAADLSIDPVFLKRLWALCCAIDAEVSGYGEVHQLGDNRLHIPDLLHVPPQTVSGGGTTFEATPKSAGTGDLGDIVHRYMMEKRDPGLLRFWFHSHFTHEAYFSGTDEKTIGQLYSDCDPPLFVAGVMNQRGQSCWRIVAHGVHVERYYELDGLDPSRTEIARAKALWLGPHVKEDFNYGKFNPKNWAWGGEYE